MKLISVFVFATWIVQSLYSPICIGPGRKPECWFSHDHDDAAHIFTALIAIKELGFNSYSERIMYLTIDNSVNSKITTGQLKLFQIDNKREHKAVPDNINSKPQNKEVQSTDERLEINNEIMVDKPHTTNHKVIIKVLTGGNTGDNVLIPVVNNHSPIN